MKNGKAILNRDFEQVSFPSLSLASLPCFKLFTNMDSLHSTQRKRERERERKERKTSSSAEIYPEVGLTSYRRMHKKKKFNALGVSSTPLRFYIYFRAEASFMENKSLLLV